MITVRAPALALAALLCASSVAAQAPQSPQGLVAHKGWDPAQMRERMAARRTARLHALHDVLAIRPDQEAAFAAFTAAMQPAQMGEHRPGRGDDQVSGLTTPERLDRMAQRMQDRTARRQAAFQRISVATKALYATLNPEQRRAMDALPALRGGGGRDGGWGKGRGMGGRGMGGRGMDGRGMDGSGEG
jgi:hypothetical protein